MTSEAVFDPFITHLPNVINILTFVQNSCLFIRGMREDTGYQIRKTEHEVKYERGEN